MSDVLKTLEVDSTYRNRKQNPLSSDFDIPFYLGSNPPSISLSQDPVSLAFPSETNLAYGAYPGLTTSVTLNAASFPYDDTYNNYYIENDCNAFGANHVYTLVLSYVGSTRVATVQTAITPTNNYNIVRALPLLRNTFGAGSTTTVVNLGAAASAVDGTYVNTYIRIFSGGAAFEYKQILSYVGATRLATLSSALSAAPAAGDGYMICPFTIDNFNPLIYQGTLVNQPCLYQIRLVNLIFPDIFISNGFRGTLVSYPYFYVKLYNTNYKPGNSLLITNNPNAKEAIFRIPIDTSSNQVQSFYPLYYNDTVQTVTFKPDDTLHFTVTLPNGEPIQFLYPDYYSPAAPNPFFQLSATFEIKRLTTN